MNKMELIEAVAYKTKHQVADVERVVNAVFDVIVKRVVSGDEVSLRPFGTFVKIRVEARKSWNPFLGTSMQLPARSLAKFRAGIKFKRSLSPQTFPVEPPSPPPAGVLA